MKKIKPVILESHFIKSESFNQASLHTTILVGFLVQCLMIDHFCINTIPSPSVPVCAVLSLTDWHKSTQFYTIIKPSILKMEAPACAVPSLTDWHPPKIKTKKENTKNPNQVHMYITKTVIFRKQIELTVKTG